MTCGKLAAMLQGRTVAWVAANRLLSAGIALVILAAAITFALATGGNDELKSRVTESGEKTEAAEQAGDEETAAGGSDTRGSASIGAPGGEAGSLIPGLPEGPQAAPCNPTKVNQTGVSDTEITIGQIITDNSQIPQQLKPVNEGLEAFVKLFNSAGGLCKRTLKLEYRNDNLNPATHQQDAQELANEVLAFVGNDSLLDFLDYERNPPFNPTVQGGGGYVPDVGGLAFGYGRSQSKWHAGVIGSVSPVLIGGGQFKYLIDEAKSAKKPCQKAGVVFLNEPTGASQDQASLGSIALEEKWGGNLGGEGTRMYGMNLVDDENAYGILVERMAADGMNCVFAYTDIQGSIRLVRAMNSRDYWPPDKCTRGPDCFRVAWVPFTVYDQKFIKDGGEGALNVSTFIPHIPLGEVSTPAVKVYLDALKQVSGARPSTFSIFGFASGLMLVEALQACPAAPTRDCLISSLRNMKDYTAAGLLGGTTPFRTTRATFDRYGTYDWKWIFYRSIALRVLDRNGRTDFTRLTPQTGFFEDTLKVARGAPG